MDEFEAFALAKGKKLVEATMGKPKPPEILNELLTRRDAFAAAALTGLLAHSIDADDASTIDQLAYDAFRYADAMLEERDKPA